MEAMEVKTDYTGHVHLGSLEQKEEDFTLCFEEEEDDHHYQPVR
jgi:hypothetical protein